MSAGPPASLHGPVAGHLRRDVLVVRGPEAVGYLQGQVSADVVTLEPGQSTLALLLEPTGKLEVVLRLWRTDENVVVIDTDQGAGEVAEARLRRFLLRTDATIDRLDWECVVVRGEGAGSWAGRVDDSGAELVGLGMWPGIDGIDLLGPRVEVPAGVAHASPELLEVLRIRSGWPAFGAEVAPGVIPAEVGSWLITAAVSFDKGCYVGQELTARIDSRGGNVPRHLRVLELPAGSQVSVGDAIVAREPDRAAGAGGDHVVVGTVTSAAVDPRDDTVVAAGYVKRSAPSSEALTVVPGPA